MKQSEEMEDAKNVRYAEGQKKFKVVDLCEGKETIGYADNMTEIKKLARYWCEEVAEDADIYYYPLDEETGKYKFSERKFLKTY